MTELQPTQRLRIVTMLQLALCIAACTAVADQRLASRGILGKGHALKSACQHPAQQLAPYVNLNARLSSYAVTNTCLLCFCQAISKDNTESCKPQQPPFQATCSIWQPHRICCCSRPLVHRVEQPDKNESNKATIMRLSAKLSNDADILQVKDSQESYFASADLFSKECKL